jgi:flavin reductase (DIM6/NTAB) family NADH-FMN oxidoreductase RutF
MDEEGLLLVTTGTDGKPDVMTIGWGTIGSIWARPMFVVLVWHSRYSFALMEQVSDFTC